jgi:pimeloyl-ACP methyl ester carboxylesterase
MPVVVMAGDGDRVVSHNHAERLHATIQGSTLQIIAGAGHMVHHVATPQVVQAIAQVTSGSSEGRVVGPGKLSSSPENVPEAA